MTEFGDEPRRVLAERGISLSTAARSAGCSKGYLSNAANGRKPLTPRVAAALDRLFGLDGTFVAYALTPSPSGRSAEERPSAEAERLGYVLAHPADADLVAVAQLREQVRRLDKRYDRSPTTALIAGDRTVPGADQLPPRACPPG